MTLERKDVRIKLAPDVHAALTVLAEVADIDIGAWAERELVRVVRERVHAASVVAARTARLGLSGIAGDSQGSSGIGRE